MRKLSKIFVSAFFVLTLATSSFAAFTCPTCPPGPQGIQGEQGIQGIQGEQGIPGVAGPKGATGATGAKGDTGRAGTGYPGADGINGTNGTNGVDGASFTDSAKYEGGIAGSMAMARIDHARNNGSMVGLGVANFGSENALALGVGKSWTVNNYKALNEVTADVAGFISNDANGVAGSLNFHFK
jgi:hypothetical protein